ncbi:MAG: type VI secretion system ATPase TssH [Bryobacteraceae bacterium]
MSVSLKSLIGKLNEETRTALNGAAALCMSRRQYDVEVEHYLSKLKDETDGDFQAIARYFEIDMSRLAGDLGRSLDKLKTGNARTPELSPSLVKMLIEAWSLGSLNFGAGQIRSGFTILALAVTPELNRMMNGITKEWAKINPETLKSNFASLVANSGEVAAAAGIDAGGGEGAAGGPGAAAANSKTPFLDQYTVNLTENARIGKIDPVLARDFEIRQIIDILTRRRQNNPILVGEAGVGKTAVVEGFAMRVAQGDVPGPLKNVMVRTLDLALLQAGAGVKGEFENRLKGLIEEVKRSEIPIILFIDEAHTMIGAGGQAGQNDAANLLKPALARGEMRTIAATTWSEYKKYFEKDPALARRFQPVKVGEPSEEQCALMLRGVVSSLENHHKVRILDEGVAAAVRLSHRYIADRQLPDKAVSVLDTACARLALGQAATPPAIEDAVRTLEDLAVQKRVLDREAAVGADHTERLEQIAAKQKKVEDELAALRGRWEQERGLVEKIREIRGKLETGDAADAAELRAELDKLNQELETLQGEQPLINVCVDAQVVGEVISGWTGIPVGKMLKDEIGVVLELEKHLNARVIGQSHALESISQRIRTSRASLDDPIKPVGVFLLVGPSGVGKTETALALSDLMYGGERNMISINMSEFQEAHTVSTLKGSPPGYVGYGEGGVLTEAVRRKPYSVVLLDEVEKAHPDVLELFFQVFDKGQMEDGEGREIDFKNTIIILTSNASTETIMKLTADPETMPSAEGLAKTIKPELDKVFKPAFLGRLVVIPYYPVRDENLKQIIRLKLGKIKRRLMENHRVELTWTDAVVDQVAARCTEVESGARNVDNILTNTMLPAMSRQLLTAMAEGISVSAVKVDVDESGSFIYG